MDNLNITIGAILFILGWYGLSKIVGWMSRGLQKSRLVWCSRANTFSLIETAASQPGITTKPEICRCLLWPEHHNCDQSCLQSKPFSWAHPRAAKQSP
jgi:hypothetical protein